MTSQVECQVTALLAEARSLLAKRRAEIVAEMSSLFPSTEAERICFRTDRVGLAAFEWLDVGETRLLSFGSGREENRPELAKALFVLWNENSRLSTYRAAIDSAGITILELDGQ